jgi:YGGT family
MTYAEERSIVTQRPTVEQPGGPLVTTSRETVSVRPSPAEILRRVVVLLFGLVQLLVGLRVLLELVGAEPANPLVRFVMGLSWIFVHPFAGILSTSLIRAGSVTLDVTAIVALIGLTLLELIVLGIVDIFRRERA